MNVRASTEFADSAQYSMATDLCTLRTACSWSGRVKRIEAYNIAGKFVVGDHSPSATVSIPVLLVVECCKDADEAAVHRVVSWVACDLQHG